MALSRFILLALLSSMMVAISQAATTGATDATDATGATDATTEMVTASNTEGGTDATTTESTFACISYDSDTDSETTCQSTLGCFWSLNTTDNSTAYSCMPADGVTGCESDDDMDFTGNFCEICSTGSNTDDSVLTYSAMMDICNAAPILRISSLLATSLLLLSLLITNRS